MRIRERQPSPLGATWDGLGVNFALFSANARRVELCLFDSSGLDAVYTLTGRSLLVFLLERDGFAAALERRSAEPADPGAARNA